MQRSPSVEDGFDKYLEDASAAEAARRRGSAAAPTAAAASIDAPSTTEAAASAAAAPGLPAGSLSGARRASTGSSFDLRHASVSADVFSRANRDVQASWAAPLVSPQQQQQRQQPETRSSYSSSSSTGSSSSVWGDMSSPSHTSHPSHHTPHNPHTSPHTSLAPGGQQQEVEGPLAPAELGIADSDQLGPLAAAARADALRVAASGAPSAVAPGSRNFSRLRSEFSSNVGPVHHELRRRFQRPSPSSFLGLFDEHQAQWRTRSGVQSTRWRASLPGEETSPTERPLLPSELAQHAPRFSLAPPSVDASSATRVPSNATRRSADTPRRRIRHPKRASLREEPTEILSEAPFSSTAREAPPSTRTREHLSGAPPDHEAPLSHASNGSSTSSSSVVYATKNVDRGLYTPAETPVRSPLAASAPPSAKLMLPRDFGTAQTANRVHTPQSDPISTASRQKKRSRRLIRSAFASAPRPPFDFAFESPSTAARVASDAATAAARASRAAPHASVYSNTSMGDTGSSLSPEVAPVDGAFGVKGLLRRKYKVFYRQAAPECIGRFQLGDMLGDGAYGKVREAVDTSTGQQVAVKILDLKKLSKLRDTRQGIEREISTLRKLNHKNIVKIIDVMEDEKKQKLLIVLELVEGGSLLTRIEDADCGRLSSAEARPYFRKLIKALRYCHSRGVVHLDVKPSNCLTTSTGELKLADFGVSHQLEDPNNDFMDTHWTTTPAFMAPEVATGDNEKVHGYKVDVWAAGVTLYLMVTGQPPFKGVTVYKVYQSIARGVYSLPDYLHPDLQDLIKRMLQREPAARLTLDDVLRHPWVAKSEPIPSSVSEYVSKKHVRLQDRLETVAGAEELEEVAVEVINDAQLAELDVYVEEDEQSVRDPQELDNFEGQGEDLPVLRPLDSERLKTCTIL